MKRLFIVGCSRSGTTVVQKKLCEALALYSLPETAYFCEGLANPVRRLSALRRLGRAQAPEAYASHAGAGRQAQETISRWLPGLGLWGLSHCLLSRRRAARVLVQTLDRAAAQRKEQGWVEKTPLHCLRIDQIRSVVSPDGFVFVLRYGPDNVASIRDRALRFPERFAQQATTWGAADLWNTALQAARSQLKHDDVYFVSYEAFVRDPDLTVLRIGQRFGIEPLEGSRSSSVIRLYEEAEGWKETVGKPIRPQPSKWCQVFNAEERAELEQRLQLDAYRELMEALRRDPARGVVASSSLIPQQDLPPAAGHCS